MKELNAFRRAKRLFGPALQAYGDEGATRRSSRSRRRMTSRLRKQRRPPGAHSALPPWPGAESSTNG